LVNSLADEAQHPILDPLAGEAEEPLDKLPWLQDFNIAQVVLDVAN
jgi:hypothetical protein